MTIAQPLIAVEELHYRAPAPRGEEGLEVIRNLTMHLRKGEFLSVIGPSGCGKSTLMRLIAGLSKPTTGEVCHAGQPIDSPPGWLALVFQDYSRSLFPWLSVRRNVAFGLRRLLPKAERQERVGTALTSVGLEDFTDHYPWQLSGGMQQRVALARAIARQPEVLLLDEPFGSVDAQTRMGLQILVLELVAGLGISTILVTHDMDEAILMGDRVLVLSRRPAEIVKDVPVRLARPRDPVASRGLEEFAALRTDVHDSLRGAVRLGFSQDGQ